jgi:CBS domain-containing protein
VSPVPRVPADLKLPALVEAHLLRNRGTAFGVEAGGQTVGLISGAQLARVSRSGWMEKRVQDVMIPLDRTDSVRPDDSALVVMLKLTKDDGAGPGELPVILDGQLVGLVGQEEIGRYLKWKAT